MSVLVLDAGNSIIKFKRGDGAEDEFPHALKELSETDYKHILDRNNGRPPIDYISVNGKPYVYGEQAERYGTLTHRHRAERYAKDYYGIFVSIALSRLYDRGGEYSLFGSHAPGDVEYRDDLMQAAAGVWEVEIEGKQRTYKVNYVNTFDEPQGGLMNVILAEDGQHYKHSDINGGRALVIDVGGRTTDWLAVNPGGDVDYSLDVSTDIGILNVIQDFEKSFRASHRDLIKANPNLPPDRVREAIAHGVFRGGGKEYPCEGEVSQATNALLNRIKASYRDVAGGPVPWDSIILTGGGSAMLYDHLLPILEHEHVLLADEPAKIHMANVRGGLKLWRFYEAEGLLE
jgi:hypothetical protein